MSAPVKRDPGPLTALRRDRARVAPFVCDVCGEPSEFLSTWREHDHADKPIRSPGAIVYLGEDHKACMARLKRHPLLYAEETSDPGRFPRLCGPCVHRRGDVCTHADLIDNGGEGLRVDLTDPMRGIVCLRGARGQQIRIVRQAIKCAGFADARLP